MHEAHREDENERSEQRVPMSPVTMAFVDQELEASFLRSHALKSKTPVKSTILMAAILMSLFGILDALVGGSARDTLWLIRFGVVCPLMFGVFVATRARFFVPHIQKYQCIPALIGGLGIVAMIAVAEPPGSYLYYAGLILVLMFSYTFLRQRFFQASIVGATIIVAYELTAIFVSKTPLFLLINNNFFFISANVIGMFACRRMESQERAAFRHLLTIERDKAELARNEQQLMQVQRREAIGTLAAGVAHDFNNILMGIQGHCSLLRMDLEEGHPHRGHVQSIEWHIASASRLTKQMLGLAQGGKYEVRTSDLNRLVEGMATMVARTWKENVLIESYADDLKTVEIDRGQIEQVLLNLLVNAGQAMPNGGRVHVTTKNTEVLKKEAAALALNEGFYALIEVRDEGEGMDAAIQERIFDPFFTTKGMQRGTGLGLASSYGIMKNHGGAISVESERGRGTTFRVFLPASDKVAIESVAPPANHTDRESRTLLVVDDEVLILRVASRVLKRLGYVTLVASGGKQAVEIFDDKKAEIDLIIMDMVMPEMSGAETFERLREIDPKVKVLLASGYSLDDEAARALERGCQGFIQKPFREDELIDKINSVLLASEPGG